MNLAEKYRPRSFDQLSGQPLAVEALRDEFGPNRHRAVLLVGPSGTGKTTAARLAAKLVVCRAAPGVGCGACSDCEAIEKGHFAFGYQEIDGGHHHDRETGKHVAEMLKTSPLCEWVMFIDEVHAIDREAANALLKAVERPSSTTSFIGATTDEHLVHPMLRSRCRIVYFKPLSPGSTVKLMSSVCEQEGIRFEPMALDMIAARARGSAREALICLEQAAERGEVTAEGVAELFAIGGTSQVLNFLAAAAAGDIEAQERTLYEWQATPAEKGRMIRDCILYIYNFEVSAARLNDIVDPAFFQVTAAERRAIVEAFRPLAKQRRLDHYWLDLLEMWDIDPTTITDGPSLSIKVRRFQLALHPDGPPALGGSAPMPSPPPAAPAEARKRPFRRRSARQVPTYAGRRPAADAGYLNQGQAEQIYDMATFLPQHHRLLFNTRILLDHARLGTGDEPSAGRLVSDLTHEVGERVKTWARGERAHWIYGHRAQEGCILSEIILHIPAAALPKIEAYVAGWLARRCQEGAKEPGAWLVEAASSQRATGWDMNRVQRHWHLVRQLWGGVDPHISDWDERGRRAPLLDLLKVPAAMRRPIGHLVKLAAIGGSRSLGPAARRAGAGMRMAFLSAFADDAWGALASGWELKEYKDRQAEAERRRDDEIRVAAEFPTSMNALERDAAATALAKLRESWPADPRSRRRSWIGWWANEGASPPNRP